MEGHCSTGPLRAVEPMEEEEEEGKEEEEEGFTVNWFII